MPTRTILPPLLGPYMAVRKAQGNSPRKEYLMQRFVFLIITLLLATGCASTGSLPQTVHEAGMDDSIGGKVGWSRHQTSEFFPGVDMPTAISAAREGLNLAGFIIKRDDPKQGVVIGEHGMTMYDWNIVCGVYIVEQPNGCKAKIIAQGSKDVGFSGDATGSDWPQDVLRGMRRYIARNTLPPSQRRDNDSVSLGTGFAINPRGHIVTAFHVVDGKDTIMVKFENGNWIKAALVGHSSVCDIAVLKVASPTAAFLTVAKSVPLDIGDDVFTIGYPATDLLGLDQKYTNGALSSLTGLQGDATLMQTTVPVQPGNSGGALVSMDGTVVGIVLSTAAVEGFYKATGTLPQNINWAIKSDIVHPIISEHIFGLAPIKFASKKDAILRVRAATCHVKGEN